MFDYARYVTGWLESLVWIAIACSTVPAILLVTFPFMPESPVWLVARNRRDEAKSAIRRLRGPGYDAEYELSLLERSQASQGEKVGVAELSHHKMGLLIALGKPARFTPGHFEKPVCDLCDRKIMTNVNSRFFFVDDHKVSWCFNNYPG